MGIRRFCVSAVVLALAFALAPHASAQPTISIDSATFTVGQPGEVEISATEDADISLAEGDLPEGVTFTPGQGTATISGTPETGEEGSYPLTIMATTADDESCDETNTDTCSIREFTLVVLAAAATPTPTPTAAPVAAFGATCRTLNSSQVADTTFVRGERFFVTGVLPGVRNVTALFNGVTSIGVDGADAGGRYLVAAQIPLSARLGANTVIARGAAGTAIRQATCGINVVSGAVLASRAGATLPRTGYSIPVMIAFAITLVEVGAGLLLYADGRRQSPVVAPYVHRVSAGARQLLHGRRNRIF